METREQFCRKQKKKNSVKWKYETDRRKFDSGRKLYVFRDTMLKIRSLYLLADKNAVRSKKNGARDREQLRISSNADSKIVRHIERKIVSIFVGNFFFFEIV